MTFSTSNLFWLKCWFCLRHLILLFWNQTFTCKTWYSAPQWFVFVMRECGGSDDPGEAQQELIVICQHRVIACHNQTHHNNNHTWASVRLSLDANNTLSCPTMYCVLEKEIIINLWQSENISYLLNSSSILSNCSGVKIVLIRLFFILRPPSLRRSSEKVDMLKEM